MNHGSVIALAQQLAYSSVGAVGVLFGQIHGNLPGVSHLLLFGAGLYQLGFQIVVFAHLIFYEFHRNGAFFYLNGIVHHLFAEFQVDVFAIMME